MKLFLPPLVKTSFENAVQCFLKTKNIVTVIRKVMFMFITLIKMQIKCRV